MAAVSPEVEKLMKEYRHALDDGLNRESDRYTLISIAHLNGLSNVGVAYCVQDQSMYLLVDDTAGNHNPEHLPFFLLDTAKELTEFFRTFVVPDQTSRGETRWGGKDRGPIKAYRFKLADSPAYLRT